VKNSCIPIFLAMLLSSLATMAADLETIVLQGTRDKVPPHLIVELAKVADFNNDQYRTSISRSLTIILQHNPALFLNHSEMFREIKEFTYKKIGAHLDYLMENGVSCVSVDFSAKLTETLTQLPDEHVAEYLNKIQRFSFKIAAGPTMDKNTPIINPMLRVFGRIINFDNINTEQMLSIIKEMPPQILHDYSDDISDPMKHAQYKAAAKNYLTNFAYYKR